MEGTQSILGMQVDWWGPPVSWNGIGEASLVRGYFMPLLASKAQQESKMYYNLLLTSCGTCGIHLRLPGSQASCCPAEQAGKLSGFICSLLSALFPFLCADRRSDCTPHLALTLCSCPGLGHLGSDSVEGNKIELG